MVDVKNLAFDSDRVAFASAILETPDDEIMPYLSGYKPDYKKIRLRIALFIVILTCLLCNLWHRMFYGKRYWSSVCVTQVDKKPSAEFCKNILSTPSL